MGLGGSKPQSSVGGLPPPLTASQKRTLAAANQILRDVQGRSGLLPSNTGAFPVSGPPGTLPLLPTIPYNNPMGPNAIPPPVLYPPQQGQNPYPPRPIQGNMPMGGNLSSPSYGQSHSPQFDHHRPYPSHTGAYRDTDFAAVANIAGLNPADIALLHREYTHLTRGGINKIDRVVFRQLLRETLLEINNENIDRTIENIFVAIDRNHDGFIDFPEFVGAFRDVLKGGPIDSQNLVGQFASQKYVNDQLQANGISHPLTFIQQPQSAGQILPYPSTVCQQAPIVYESVNPMDYNQSPYLYQTCDQPMLGQSSSLSCLSPTFF